MVDAWPDPVLVIHDLVKTFGSTRALDGLDLTVAAGEVHGFLGPNGAGKSTTIRSLLGLLRTDSGTITVFGLDPWRDSVPIHRRLAYVPGDVTLWPNLSGGETIDMLLRMRGVEPRSTPARGAARALRPRPHQARPGLLQGQPAEGRAGRGVRRRRRPARPRRADVGAGPADGGGLRRLPGRAGRGGHHRAAVEPHPQRGRAARRPGHHHPRGPQRRERHPGRAAAPAADQGRGRGGRPGAGPHRAAGRDRRTRRRDDASRARSSPRPSGPCSPP